MIYRVHDNNKTILVTIHREEAIECINKYRKWYNKAGIKSDIKIDSYTLKEWMDKDNRRKL